LSQNSCQPLPIGGHTTLDKGGKPAEDLVQSEMEIKAQYDITNPIMAATSSD